MGNVDDGEREKFEFELCITNKQEVKDKTNN